MRGAYPCRRCNIGVATKGSYPHTESTPEITERHPRTWVTRVIHTRSPPEGWSKAVGEELKVDPGTRLFYFM